MTQKILVADDSVTIRKVVELTFSDEDVRIIAVADGAQALESARTERPDLVISDVSMPGLDGYELCGRIKADEGLRTVPVLLLRGTFEGFDEGKAASCGADGVIVKPFEAREMVQKVKELIAAAAAAPAPRPQAAPAGARPAPVAPPPASLPAQAPAPPPAPPAPPRPAVPIVAAGASLGTPAPASANPATAPRLAPPPPARPAPPLPPPPAPARPVAFEEPPAELAEEDFDLGPAPPAAAAADDDLWSEVSLRGSTAPIIDPAVGEDNLWGSLADTSVLDEQPVPAPAAQSIPPGVAPSRAEPPGAAARAALVEAATARATPAVPSVDPALIERLVAERLDAAVRQALEPLVAGMARQLLEDVAWQILPEMAEAMIRAEIGRIARGADGG
jgi:CheY-like chemotaxis protein